MACGGGMSASPYESSTARFQCASLASASAAGMDGSKTLAASSVSLPWSTHSSVQNPVAMPGGRTSHASVSAPYCIFEYRTATMKCIM